MSVKRENSWKFKFLLQSYLMMVPSLLKMFLVAKPKPPTEWPDWRTFSHSHHIHLASYVVENANMVILAINQNNNNALSIEQYTLLLLSRPARCHRVLHVPGRAHPHPAGRRRGRRGPRQRLRLRLQLQEAVGFHGAGIPHVHRIPGKENEDWGRTGANFIFNRFQITFQKYLTTFPIPLCFLFIVTDWTFLFEIVPYNLKYAKLDQKSSLFLQLHVKITPTRPSPSPSPRTPATSRATCSPAPWPSTACCGCWCGPPSWGCSCRGWRPGSASSRAGAECERQSPRLPIYNNIDRMESNKVFIDVFESVYEAGSTLLDWL